MGDGTQAGFDNLNMTLDEKVGACCGEWRQKEDQMAMRGEYWRWILKPSATNRGAGIQVFDIYEEVRWGEGGKQLLYY